MKAARRLRVFLQSQSGTFGMKNGREATSRFRVNRIQGERNTVGWDHPGLGVGLDFLCMFAGTDYFLDMDNERKSRKGLQNILHLPLY